jgi:hypothetical protein
MQHIAEIMADYNEAKKQVVLADTWGYLAPKKEKEYRIKILFSESSYGGEGTSLIDTKLGDGLKDSPWLYDAILYRINKAMKRKPGVYLIDGVIKNYRIVGKSKQIVKL